MAVLKVDIHVQDSSAIMVSKAPVGEVQSYELNELNKIITHPPEDQHYCLNNR